MAAASCRAVAAERGRAMSGGGGRTRPRHVGRWRSNAAAPCRAVAAERGRAMSGGGGRTRPRHVGRWRPNAAAPCRAVAAECGRAMSGSGGRIMSGGGGSRTYGGREGHSRLSRACRPPVARLSPARRAPVACMANTFISRPPYEPCRAVAAECGRAMSGSGGRTRPRHVGRWRTMSGCPNGPR